VSAASARVFSAGDRSNPPFILLLSLSGVYVSNNHTLSAVFDRDVGDSRELKAWRAFVMEFTWPHCGRDALRSGIHDRLAGAYSSLRLHALGLDTPQSG